MSQTTLTINGETLLDHDLNQYTNYPPQLLQELAQHKTKNTKPEPHIQAALAAIIHAIQTQQPVTINIDTDHLGWRMTVTHDADQTSRRSVED